MFKKKKNKDSKNGNSSNNNNTSNNQETTVTKTKDGATITSTVSSTTSTTKYFSRKETTIQFTSKATGSLPSLTNGGRFSGPIFSSRSIFDNNCSSDRRIQHDARPFDRTSASYSSQRINLIPARIPFTSATYGSYPSRSNPTHATSRPSVPAITYTPPASITSSVAPAANFTVSPNIKSVVPTYEHTSYKLGKALVINNMKFVNTAEERKGAMKDSKDLKKLLNKLGFDVIHEPNVKGKDMLKKAKDFSKSSFSQHNISLVVMMSHGNNTKHDNVRSGLTQIYGVDGEGILVEDIIDLFTNDRYHASLRGKPKIFIFQCCRGSEDQVVVHDAAPIKSQLKQYADILVAFSTLPGFVSNRNPSTGSWYIQSLCQVVERHYEDHHIEDMLKIVDNELNNKHPQYTQTSTYESRGFKRCFLTKKKIT